MSTPASPHSNSAGVGQQAVGQQAVSQWGVSQYPAPKRRNTTTIVGIVAVVVLIVAGGVFYAVNLSGVKQGFVDDRFRFSNAWVNGGEQVWVLSDIPDTIDGPVVAQNDRMVIVTKDPADPNGRVLTGYDIEGNDPSLEWSRNIVIDPELEGPVMLMDTYVVYAGQIFDIYDGEFRDSAWARDAKIVIDPSWPDSIACVPGRECTGQHLGDGRGVADTVRGNRRRSNNSGRPRTFHTRVFGRCAGFPGNHDQRADRRVDAAEEPARWCRGGNRAERWVAHV